MPKDTHGWKRFRREAVGDHYRRGGPSPGGGVGRAATGWAAPVVLAAGLVGPACLVEDTTADKSSTLSGEERSGLVAQVRQQAAEHDVDPIPPAPDVRDELFELGQKLAFDKILSGNKNIACMSCHFPSEPFSTGDNRHLALGEGGVDLGGNRLGGGVEPRNSQPLFNLHALNAMFWDMRVEIAPDSEGPPQLRTPADEELTQAMQDVFEFGAASAQAMFPVTSRLEMRGQWFTNAPNDNELGEDMTFTEIWEELMARLGEIPEYVAMFEAAYPGTDFEDMTFAHAANAIAGFEVRAFESRGSPWQRFLEGNDDALSDSALRGARDFFSSGCATCHSGPMLTDVEPHNTALAQFGAGKGDGPYNNDDIGFAGEREPFNLGRVPNGPGTPELNCNNGENPHNLYGFRTPPLNNVELSGPWGHAGQFSDLREFVAHYEDPEESLRNYDMADQIRPSEKTLLDTRLDNSHNVLSCIDLDTEVSIPDMDDMMAFLEAQTDPAARNLDSTIPDEVPSGLSVSNGEAPEVTGLTESTVTFTNIAKDPDSALSQFRRVPSARKAKVDQMREDSLTHPQDLIEHLPVPLRWRGQPGVAVLDYNGDGALDIFVTNGPGAPNQLFENQLASTGELEFVERAEEAGVAAVAMDGAGVCYGDIDNSGYPDLYVVADNGPSSLFKNNGDGTFTDISDASNATPDGVGGTSCAFGDVTGNGKLDLFVGRAWDMMSQHACFTDPFHESIQQNELYINQGGGVFEDVSDTSGIRDVAGLPADSATITWAVAIVDYNQDGYMDIIHADDQCALPQADFEGIDRGFLQIFENDGTGNFVNRTIEAGLNTPSTWMGLAFGDFNTSGQLDVFSTSFGNWGEPFLGGPALPETNASRWLLQQEDNSFIDPQVGELQTTPFGWGTSARDFDNSGTTDLAWQGGLHLYFHVEASNPGTMLLGDGTGRFEYAPGVFEDSYTRRNILGVAVGDLDQDGFQDIVSVSNFDIPDDVPVTRYGAADNEVFFFSAFDPTAYFIPMLEHVTKSAPGLAIDMFRRFEPQNKFERRWSHNENIELPNGTLAVELNNAENGNKWVSVELMGAADLIPDGAVNRSGIGATVTFTPEGGDPVISPVLGGSSHLSQDSLIQGFGLGQAHRGTVDILWPGGTKNRLYDVQHGERVFIPELPCSYDTSDDRGTYAACVEDKLSELEHAGAIDANLRARLESSALRAYDDEN